MFDDLYIAAKIRWQHFWEDQSGVEGIVVAVILIVVAVAAAYLFRTQIGNLINSWFEQTKVDENKWNTDLPTKS